MSVKFTSKGLADGTDDTKELEFNVTGVTTGTTRTINVTSTGINVPGSVTADGLTVQTTAGIGALLESTGTSYQYLQFKNTIGAQNYLGFVGNDFTVTAGNTKYLQVDGGTGDISFYEDTGTTPKFFWDASAESLTLGNGGSEGTLNVGGAASSIAARFTDSITSSVVVRPESGGAIIGTDGGGTLHLAANGSTLSDRKMTITTTGNVGIGTSSPDTTLQLYKPNTTVVNTGYDGAELYLSGKGWDSNLGAYTHGWKFSTPTSGYSSGTGHSNSHLVFSQMAADGIPGLASPSFIERMRINSSGTLKSTVNGAVANLLLENDADTPYMAFTESGAAQFFIGESSIVGGGYGYDIYAASGQGITFFTNATRRVDIDPFGNVGIGTSNPSGKLEIKGATGKHSKIIHSHNAISGSGEAAIMAEGTVAVTTASAGTTLSIPVFSQPNVHRRYTVEMMFTSGEYNDHIHAKYGTATLKFASLNSINHVILAASTGNVASVSSSGMNVQINFTSGYTGGTSNLEGVLVYYRVLGSHPSYFQAWNASLN